MKIEQITSRDNQRLVNARKVRDAKRPDKIFIEGRRLVEEALRSGVVIEECFFAEDLDDDKLRRAFNGRVFEVPPVIFRSIADTDHPQGVIVIAQRPPTSRLKVEPAPVPVYVFLSEINNPSNLGAVIRAAEAAGVAGVIVSSNSADVFSPKALRAAMGSSFRVPIWDRIDLHELIRWAKKYDLTITAAETSATTSYLSIDWREPRVLIFGSEAHGLNEDQLAAAAEVISIPMESTVESLNLAVSAGVILFEARRQNGS